MKNRKYHNYELRTKETNNPEEKKAKKKNKLERDSNPCLNIRQLCTTCCTATTNLATYADTLWACPKSASVGDYD